MTSFRGKPTVFGNTVCDSEGECIQEEVIQYNVETDSWERIGELLHYRGFSAIVEVPQEFCEAADYPDPSTNTVALIVGGIRNVGSDETVLDSVELFGCPSSLSIPFNEKFPVSISMTSGIHSVSDEENNPMGMIIVCGGMGCDANGTCEEMDSCWEFNPVTLTWNEAGYTLLSPRYGHVMSLSPDLDSGTNNRVPLVLGGSVEETEIWNSLLEEWKDYR